MAEGKVLTIMLEDLPHPKEQADARRFYARMLLTRGRPGDKRHADDLIRQAARRYQRLQLSLDASDP
jgi:hypothetical protein